MRHGKGLKRQTLRALYSDVIVDLRVEHWEAKEMQSSYIFLESP
jgi:hypothetical protein